MMGTRWSAVRSVLVLLTFGITACGGDSSGPPKAGPPAALAVVSGSAQEGQSGEALATPLTVKVTDQKGLAVSKAVVTFNVTGGGGTLSQRTDTTDTEGTASTIWTMGPELGEGRVEARVTGLTAPAVFTAIVKAGPPTLMLRTSEVVGNSAGGFDVADSVAIKVTDRFEHPVAGTTVTFSVAAGGGTISHATKVTNDDGIARTAWKLGAAGPQTLRAVAGSLNVEVTGTAVACAEQSMAVGDVVTISQPDNTCIVTNNGGTQKYLVAVANTSSAPSSFAPFRVRGAGGGTATSTNTVTAPAAAFSLPRLSAAQAERLDRIEDAAEAHDHVLRANLQLLERLKPQARAIARARVSGNLVQSAPLPNVGDMISINIPKDFTNLCSTASDSTIRARVVYVGTRAVILEDSASLLAGQFDERYAAVGKEFDDVMFPILRTNFGDPLAMDAQTDANGRLFMVFSPVVNQIQGGNIAGFVTSGDFFPTSQCPASNFGEYFYARVPTVAGTGFGTGTVEDWSRRTRTVIIHEVKHITSFGEKFASPEILPSGFFARDQWLEESSAMAAEELWARGIFNYAPKTNVDYAQSIYCEVRPTPNASWPECQPTKPLAMIDHFFYVYDYLSNAERKSAVGAVDSNDFSFYGSGWLFLRWVIDNYAISEAAFLTGITREMQKPGTENIEKHSNRALADLLADFALAVALDDYPGFTARDAKHSIASWNTRDIFTGLNRDFATTFTTATPLRPRANGFGQFVVDIPSVRGGGFALFEVAGTSTNKQLLEFRGASGTSFPAEMRVKVVRVQ